MGFTESWFPVVSRQGAGEGVSLGPLEWWRVSRGRNQTPHDISNILFKRFRANLFFHYTAANSTFLPQVVSMYSQIIIRRALRFVCVICKVEAFVVRWLFSCCKHAKVLFPVTVQIRAWSLQTMSKLATQVIQSSTAHFLFTWAHLSSLRTGTPVSMCTHILRHTNNPLLSTLFCLFSLPRKFPIKIHLMFLVSCMICAD